MNNEDNNINFSANNTQSFLKSPKSVKKRKVIIYASIITLIIISIILILIFAFKKNKETNKNNINLPSIFIENLNNSKYCGFSILILNCINLNYYNDIKNTDISFKFILNNY